MKSLLIAITAGALTMSSVGQGVTTMSSAGDGSELNGTELVAELSQSVNSRKVKLGDPVKATLTQDVISHGKIVIRRGSRLVGHVTEVKPRSKEDQESRLGMVFDKALLKSGQEIDFNAAVRALAPPARVSGVDKPDMMGPPITGLGNQSTNPQPLSGGTGGMSASRSSSSNSSGSINSNSNQASRVAEFGAASPGSSALGGEGSVMGGGSRGVFGMPGVKLGSAARGQDGSVISSHGHDVKLDSGTQMVIQVTTPVR